MSLPTLEKLNRFIKAKSNTSLIYLGWVVTERSKDQKSFSTGNLYRELVVRSTRQARANSSHF